MLSYQMRVENRASIIAFASAGVRERVVPRWLVPNQDQNPADYVAGAATGAVSDVRKTVKQTPKALTKAGSVAKVMLDRVADSQSVQKVDGASDLFHGAGDLAANTGEMAGEVVNKTQEVAGLAVNEAHKVILLAK